MKLAESPDVFTSPKFHDASCYYHTIATPNRLSTGQKTYPQTSLDLDATAGLSHSLPTTGPANVHPRKSIVEHEKVELTEMFDTYICVVGTALNRPERRLITSTDAMVASFRVASHPRRYDQKAEKWVDAPSLRIKVNCWRRLGEHVATSIIAGDPVVVYGRIATRTWQTESGERRSSYELEADSVGHDLARGTSDFRKARFDAATTVVEDDDSANRVNGERTQGLEDPYTNDGLDDDLTYGETVAGLESGHDAPVPDLDELTILREAGVDSASSDAEGGDDEEDTGEEELSGAASGSGGTAGRSRRRGRQPVPA
jgi:single-strand DNA-binding protein